MSRSGRFQEWTTALKFFAFLVLVAGGLLAPGPASPAPTAAVAAPTLVGIVIALQAVVITYGGWQSALYFTEEDPDRRAIFRGR